MKAAFIETSLEKKIYSFDFEKRVDHAVRSFFSGLDQLLNDEKHHRAVLIDFTKKTNTRQWLN